MMPTSYRAGAAVLNTLYQSVAATVPGVTYLPTWNVFANAKGQYQNAAPVNRVRTLLREADGIHFSYVGENVFATYVTNEIATIYHVRLVPSQPAFITG